jgi:hypothetical protein
MPVRMECKKFRILRKKGAGRSYCCQPGLAGERDGTTGSVNHHEGYGRSCGQHHRVRLLLSEPAWNSRVAAMPGFPLLNGQEVDLEGQEPDVIEPEPVEHKDILAEITQHPGIGSATIID